MKLIFLPVTKERWHDFEALFGERGACGGCWCMWWRLTKNEFEAQKGEGNRRAMMEIVEGGRVPGILAYHEGRPVGWCSVAPRTEFPRLGRSKALLPIDDRPVWSIVCFFTAKPYRRKSVSRQLLRAAVDYVKEQGGLIAEGYPVEPKTDKIPDLFAYHGLASAFREAGFEEVARRTATRPVMRYYIAKSQA